MLRGRRKKGDGLGIKGPPPATPAMEDFSIAWVLNRWRLPGDEHAGFTSGSVWLKFVYGLLMQLTCKSTVGGILMVIVRVINLPKTMVTEMKTSSFLKQDAHYTAKHSCTFTQLIAFKSVAYFCFIVIPVKPAHCIRLTPPACPKNFTPFVTSYSMIK